MDKKPIDILIADDDEDDCRNTKDAFDKNHLANRLFFVRDGAELLDFLKGRGKHVGAPRPGLILLDLNMPKVDGREALREIKADPELRSIPVVILTTSKEEEDILRSYDLGASSFITKPVAFDALVKLVSNLGGYWFQLVALPAPEAER